MATIPDDEVGRSEVALNVLVAQVRSDGRLSCASVVDFLAATAAVLRAENGPPGTIH